MTSWDIYYFFVCLLSIKKLWESSLMAISIYFYSFGGYIRRLPSINMHKIRHSMINDIELITKYQKLINVLIEI